MDFMEAVRRFSLRDLTEDTQDEMVGSLRSAQRKINAARAAIREQESFNAIEKARILTSLYESGEAGKNAKERELNEALVLSKSLEWASACDAIEALQREIEEAQSELAAVTEEIKAVNGKARLLAGMFYYCGAMGMPIEDILRSTKGRKFVKRSESNEQSRSEQEDHYE